MMMPPIGPQYEPDQIKAMNTADILQRQQPATPATWIVGIIVVVAAVAWIALVIVRLRA